MRVPLELKEISRFNQPLPKWAASLITVCNVVSRLIQVTVAPTGTLIVSGWKALFFMYTSSELGAAVGVVAVDGSKALSRRKPVTIPTRETVMAVKVSLLLSLIATLPPYRAADSDHSAAIPIMDTKAPIGKKALKAVSLFGNMRPASL